MADLEKKYFFYFFIFEKKKGDSCLPPSVTCWSVTLLLRPAVDAAPLATRANS